MGPCPGPSGEEALHPHNGFAQALNVLEVVVKGEGGTCRGGHAVALEERLGAVVPGADGHAVGVEEGADVVGVDALHKKGEDGGLVRSGAEDAEPVDGGELGGGGFEESLFVGQRTRPVEAVEVVDGGGKANDTSDVRGAGLEFAGDGLVGGAAEVHPLDHIASALVRGEALEPLAAAPEHADPGGPEDLVAGKHEEVAAQLGNIDRGVRDALRAVDEHRHASGVRLGDDFLDRIYRAEGVGAVHDGDELCPFVEQAAEGFHVEHAAFINRDDFQLRAGLLAGDLPGHDIGVVLHVRDQDFITGLENRLSKAMGNQIDALGCAAGENDLVGVGQVEHCSQLRAGGFVSVGGPLAEVVDAAVDIGILRRVVGIEGIEDAARLLGSGGIVQVGQGLAPHFSLKDGKVRPYGLAVECLGSSHMRQCFRLPENLN